MSIAQYQAQRARFVADSVATASPARLVTMLYDRLVLDLTRGETAQREGDRGGAAVHLMHAQEIVAELSATLRPGAWDGATALASVYTYLYSQLVRANVSGDAKVTATCRDLVEPLRDAWAQAALALSGQAALAAGA